MRAAAWFAKNTVALPSWTVALLEGGLWNGPEGAVCAGSFCAVLPFTAARLFSMKTEGARSPESAPLNGSGVGVGTAPFGDGTITTCVSTETTRSPSFAAGAPMVNALYPGCAQEGRDPCGRGSPLTAPPGAGRIAAAIMMFDPEYYDDEHPLVLPSNACWPDAGWGPLDVGDAPAAQASAAPPADPRTPIQRLLERFDLDDDIEQRAQIAYWNATELPGNQKRQLEIERAANKKYLTSLLQGPEEMVDRAVLQDELARALEQASEIEATARPPIAVDCDADVHISESAIPFPRWHLDPEQLATMTYPPNEDGTQPDEYRSPLLVAEPQRPLAEVDEKGPMTSDAYARMVECIRLARSMIPEVPVKPKGKKGAAPAGTLGYVSYAARSTEGWMYVEDSTSEYGAWFQELIHRKYREAKAAYERITADETSTPAARQAARYQMRQAAACIAISNQEGAPSAINTYDGLVLSWGIGIAGPGKLPETFYHITKDPRVYKALYLCGFRFEGTILGGQYHGAYQIVDLAGTPPEDQAASQPPQPSPASKPPQAPAAAGKKAKAPPRPAVVYRDQWSHRPKARKYDFEGHAYRVLKYMTSQPKLIHLLIQLAKDPLTRSVIFEPNYRMIQGFASFVRGEEIHTDALHIFVSQVKHNWGFGSSIVGWAVSRFDEDERRLLPPPGETSVEKDQAIAKGIVRYLMGRLQEQRWKRGIMLMEMEGKGLLKDPGQSAKGKLLYQLRATTEFGFQRLIDNYWKPLQQGPRAQTKSKEVGSVGLTVPNFPVEVSGSRKDGRYVWVQEPSPAERRQGKANKHYDLGPLSQFDLLFPHEDITLIGFEQGRVLIEDAGQRRTVRRDLEPTRGGAR